MTRKPVTKWILRKLNRPLITWSNNRYSDVGLYVKTGWVFQADLPPDYQYFKNYKKYCYERLSKQSLRKTEEERLSGKTESELRVEGGYHRVYDAGKKRWLLA